MDDNKPKYEYSADGNSVRLLNSPPAVFVKEPATVDVALLKEHSVAWCAVCDALSQAVPGWQRVTPKGTASAVETIRRLAAPVDMILYCPSCHLQHIDAPDERTPGWANPPHRSHLCHVCGCIWRPADVPTNGVAGIKTKGHNDSPSLEALVVARFRAGAGKELAEAWARLAESTADVPAQLGLTHEYRSARETMGSKVHAVDFDPNQPPSRLAGVSPEVTSLLADFTKALQLANKIGTQPLGDDIPFDQAAVGHLVNLQVSVEDRIKQLGVATTASEHSPYQVWSYATSRWVGVTQAEYDRCNPADRKKVPE